MVQTTPQRSEEDWTFRFVQKVCEALLGFDPNEIASLKALLEGGTLRLKVPAH
jgi:hypothetical protein